MILPNHFPADALLSVAYLDGRRAGRDGLSSFANPHPPGSPEHEQWRQGYFSTQDLEEAA